MALDLATIQAIAARKGNQFLVDQVNLRSQVLDKKLLEKDPCSGQVRIVNVQSGAIDSVSMLAGGGSYPGVAGDSIGDSSTPQQLVVRPVNFVGQVRIPFDSARVVEGKMDSINLVKRQFDEIGRALGSQLGRSMLKQVVCTYTANATGTDIATGATATLHASTIPDVTGLRIGMAYDVYAASSSLPTSTRLGRVRVATISRSSASSPAGTVTVTNLAVYEGTAGATIAGSTGAARCLVLPGSYGADATAKMADLGLAAGSGNLYGSAISGADWSGNDGSSASLTPAALRELFDSSEARSGEAIDGIVMGRLAFTDLEQSIIANNGSGTGVRFYQEGDKLDPFGKNAAMPTFRGVPVVIDDNCPALEIFLVTKSGQKLGVWDDFQPVNKEQAVSSQTRYEYLIQVFGMMNMVIEKRNSLARFNISSLS